MFALKDAFKKLNIVPEKKRKVRKGCKQIIVEILLELLELLPTSRMVLINLLSLSPVKMAQIPSKAQKRFQKMADNLFSLKFKASYVPDNTKFQYDQFMTKEVVINHVKFLIFSFKTDGPDSFLYQFVAINADYSDLWKVMKLIFIVTHGQNFTEQGFSIVYKVVSNVNMEEESLIAQRLFYNAINSADADTGIFLITKEIRQLHESPSKTEARSRK